MDTLTFFKCLSDATRLRSLLLICQMDELCVCELTAALDESQPKISRHLAQLRQCGLLQDERRGQWVYYRLNADLPEWEKTILFNTLENNADFLAAAHRRLQAMVNRPDADAICH